jgi:hypothetical protein
MNRFALWILCLFIHAAPLAGQSGFQMERGLNHVDIPFEYTNNFIIVTLRFNGIIQLKFIFDTGAEHTILSKREIGDLFGLRYEREFRVTGSDLRTELVAYLSRGIRLDIPDKGRADAEDILVLQEDYFRFEEYAGIRVQGILAATFFARYVIKINYQRQVLTLYERDAFTHYSDGFKPLPVEIYRNKPYLNTLLRMRADSAAPVKLLLDTGAGLPLLLFSNTHPLLHPPANAIVSNIGMGLGGYLEGYTGRVFGVQLGDYSQGGIVTYFQEIDTTERRHILNQRHGLIGNVLLKRFIVALDYQSGQLWLKPSRAYREVFVFDRSGLNIIAAGQGLNRFTIQSVLPNSPAAEAGLLPGDEILRVGAAPARLLDLGRVQRILQKKPGKKIRLVVRRGEEKLEKVVVLRDLI